MFSFIYLLIFGVQLEGSIHLVISVQISIWTNVWESLYMKVGAPYIQVHGVNVAAPFSLRETFGILSSCVTDGLDRVQNLQ